MNQEQYNEQQADQFEGCSYCGWTDRHECECGQELTQKECQENSALCESCLFLIKR